MTVQTPPLEPLKAKTKSAKDQQQQQPAAPEGRNSRRGDTRRLRPTGEGQNTPKPERLKEWWLKAGTAERPQTRALGRSGQLWYGAAADLAATMNAPLFFGQNVLVTQEYAGKKPPQVPLEAPTSKVTLATPRTP